MRWWTVVPGLAQIAAGFVIQFGTYLRRRRELGLVLTGIRLRFLGIGLFLLLPGTEFVITGLFDGFQVARLLLGSVFIGFAGLYFYAASDRVFRRP